MKHYPGKRPARFAGIAHLVTHSEIRPVSDGAIFCLVCFALLAGAIFGALLTSGIWPALSLSNGHLCSVPTLP